MSGSQITQLSWLQVDWVWRRGATTYEPIQVSRHGDANPSVALILYPYSESHIGAFVIKFGKTLSMLRSIFLVSVHYLNRSSFPVAAHLDEIWQQQIWQNKAPRSWFYHWTSRIPLQIALRLWRLGDSIAPVGDRTQLPDVEKGVEGQEVHNAHG